MSLSMSHDTTVLRRPAGGSRPEDARQPACRYHPPRPSETELACSRGLVFALLAVLPFWVSIAAIATLA
jgi:hypothetical protein